MVVWGGLGAGRETALAGDLIRSLLTVKPNLHGLTTALTKASHEPSKNYGQLDLISTPFPIPRHYFHY
jgi:hypothetical protein